MLLYRVPGMPGYPLICFIDYVGLFFGLWKNSFQALMSLQFLLMSCDGTVMSRSRGHEICRFGVSVALYLGQRRLCAIAALRPERSGCASGDLRSSADRSG